MQQSVRQVPTVDSKTADEALALAIRLQQQQGERVSIEQLQKTADEAGIAPTYLEEALRRVESNRVVRSEEDRKRSLTMVAALTACFGSMLAVLFVRLGESPLMLGGGGRVALALVVLLFGASLIARTRRNRS